MARGGIVLCSNVSVVANQAPVVWVGGRTSLVVFATTFPTNCHLQMQGMDGSTFLNVTTASINANGLQTFDLPAGTYRISMVGGAVAGLYANLVAVAYT